MYQQRIPTVRVYGKAILVAFYFIANNAHLTLEGARGSNSVPFINDREDDLLNASKSFQCI